MSKVLIEPPTVLAVSVEKAKINLRIDGDALDEVVTDWIEGIVAVVEHEVGQCLMQQAWRIMLDAFPAPCVCASADVCTHQIALPHPAQKIRTVSYRDSAGIRHELPEEAYSIECGELSSQLVATTGAWPLTSSTRGAVVIDVECGYGDDPASIPRAIRLYILAKLVEQFDPTSRPDKDTVQSQYLERMLDTCRTYR